MQWEEASRVPKPTSIVLLESQIDVLGVNKRKLNGIYIFKNYYFVCYSVLFMNIFFKAGLFSCVVLSAFLFLKHCLTSILKQMQ